MPREPGYHVDDPAAVGRRLREARIRANLSQRDLAFRGCTPAYISRIEAGKRIPSLQLLRELGLRLGVSADYLARGASERVFSDPVADAEMAVRLQDAASAEDVFRGASGEEADPRTRARALAGLGQLAFAQGNDGEAVEKLAQSIDLWPRLEDENPSVAETLGRAYTRTRQHDNAIATFERRLRSAREMGDVIDEVRFGVLLAAALLDAGNAKRAEEILVRALELTEDAADPLSRARQWWSQSRSHALRNDPAAAERYARLALDTLVIADHARSTALAHQVLAQIKLEEGEPKKALELLDRGTELLREAGPHERGLFLVERARTLARLDRTEEALEFASQAADVMASVGPSEEGRARAVLGEVYERLGRNGDAIDAYKQAGETLPNGDRRKLEVNAKLAELLRREGRTEEALDVLSRAVSQVDTARPRA